MKRKHLNIGDPVEVRAIPFKGRVGRVRKIGRMLVEVWCNEPDKHGRHVVTVRAKDLASISEEFVS